MADLAVTFHWPPDTLAAMWLAELADWRERARQRTQPENE